MLDDASGPVMAAVNTAVTAAEECYGDGRCNGAELTTLKESLWKANAALHCLGTDSTPCGAVKGLVLEELARFAVLTMTELVGTLETINATVQAVALACINGASGECRDAESLARTLTGQLRQEAFDCPAMIGACGATEPPMLASVASTTRSAIVGMQESAIGCSESSACQRAVTTSNQAISAVASFASQCLNWSCNLIGMTVINDAEQALETCISGPGDLCTLLVALVSETVTTAAPAALGCAGSAGSCAGIAPLLAYEATELASALTSAPAKLPSCGDVCQIAETTVLTTLTPVDDLVSQCIDGGCAATVAAVIEAATTTMRFCIAGMCGDLGTAVEEEAASLEHFVAACAEDQPGTICETARVLVTTTESEIADIATACLAGNDSLCGTVAETVRQSVQLVTDALDSCLAQTPESACTQVLQMVSATLESTIGIVTGCATEMNSICSTGIGTAEGAVGLALATAQSCLAGQSPCQIPSGTSVGNDLDNPTGDCTTVYPLASVQYVDADGTISTASDPNAAAWATYSDPDTDAVYISTPPDVPVTALPNEELLNLGITPPPSIPGTQAYIDWVNQYSQIATRAPISPYVCSGLKRNVVVTRDNHAQQGVANQVHAGYSGPYTRVTGVFVQPAFNAVCPHASANSMWTGLEGSSGLVQTGLDTSDSDLQKMYAFWEMITADDPSVATDAQRSEWGPPTSAGQRVLSSTVYLKADASNPPRAYFTVGNQTTHTSKTVRIEAAKNHSVSYWYSSDDGADVIDERTWNSSNPHRLSDNTYYYRQPATTKNEVYWSSTYADGRPLNDASYYTDIYSSSYTDTRGQNYLTGTTGLGNSGTTIGDYWQACPLAPPVG